MGTLSIILSHLDSIQRNGDVSSQGTTSNERENGKKNRKSREIMHSACGRAIAASASRRWQGWVDWFGDGEENKTINKNDIRFLLFYYSWIYLIWFHFDQNENGKNKNDRENERKYTTKKNYREFDGLVFCRWMPFHLCLRFVLLSSISSFLFCFFSLHFLRFLLSLSCFLLNSFFEGTKYDYTRTSKHFHR